MQAAYVQVQTGELRAVLRDALAGFSLTWVEPNGGDPSRVALAVIELSANRPLSRELPSWLGETRVPRLAIANRSSEDLAIEALRNGFSEYLRAPLRSADVTTALERLLPRPDSRTGSAVARIVGNSPSMQAVREQVRRVATARTHVLISGETGTGKELVAQSIHDLSPRRARPFVAVNCGALPDGLVESELFGHERGAFTGATQSRPGRVRQSNGGTLFLDEIGEMDLRAQIKLLRLLETHEVQPLGGERSQALDLRVVAASNQNLAARVRERAFREDLFYRLNVVQVEVPPLRARSEDVPPLVACFCRRFCQEFNRPCADYSDGDLALLQRYDWPGNVRELRNVIEASFVHSSVRTDGRLELPPAIIAVLQKREPFDERQRVVEALFATDWNVSRAAQRLQCSRMTLYRRMSQHQIHRPASSGAA